MASVASHESGRSAAGVHPPKLAEALGWVALAAVLLALVPLFLCMPLTPDTSFYDVGARHVLRGGRLESDLLYLPPPGMAWALAAVRATLGRSAVAARAADLAVVAAIVALLVRWLRHSGLSRAACAWSAVLLAAFYLTTTEWVQVQPDTWMLLPAVAALTLRRRNVAALTAPAGGGPPAAAWALAEGALWGAGCLVKPFVVIPGLLTWLASAALVRRTGPGRARRLVPDAAGLLAGGLLMGAVWQGWLLYHGTWQDYWRNYAEFSGDHYTRAPGLGDRALSVVTKLQPWGLLHLAALPVALAALARPLRSRGPAAPALAAESLLAGCYLGWLAQAGLLQFGFHYHMAPTVFLATALLVGWLGRRARPAWGWAALAVFWAFGVALQPAARPARLALWAECWRQGGTPELMDRLHLYETSPSCADLARVADYLRRQGAGDRDVLCYDLGTTALQADLDIRPATRQIYPATNMFYLAKHSDAIRAELMAGPQRWIVIELPPASPESAGPDAAASLPKRWPYLDPVVFRAGRYLVLEARPGRAVGD
jgi:hypothetical protein